MRKALAGEQICKDMWLVWQASHTYVACLTQACLFFGNSLV